MRVILEVTLKARMRLRIELDEDAEEKLRERIKNEGALHTLIECCEDRDITVVQVEELAHHG